MKCFLLLAAVYALIFNQWQKEQTKEASRKAAEVPASSLVKQKQTLKNSPAVVTGAVHFTTFYRIGVSEWK